MVFLGTPAFGRAFSRAPWARRPTLQALFRMFEDSGEPYFGDSRAVLERAVAPLSKMGLRIVMATELEFYLLDAKAPKPTQKPSSVPGMGRPQPGPQVYIPDDLWDIEAFLDDVYDACVVQDIPADTATSEFAPAQFEINFLHGNALDLADQVFLFKRTVREAAIEHEMHATFLAKPMSEDAGSALHIHQSVVDKQGNNVFSTVEGEPSELFYNFLGGLQRYMPDAMLIFAPYVNSYRRFLNPWDSPVNLAWAIDNRTVGLRVPDSAPEARRIENRVAGSDVNPYLAIAATLACGYLGMTEGVTATDPITGSAYGNDFGLHKHIFSAIEALRKSNAMRGMLGDEFITLYCGLKHAEFMEFEEIITPWEREILMFNV